MSLGLLGYNGCGELIFVDLLIKVWIVILFRQNVFFCLFLAPSAEIEREKNKDIFEKTILFMILTHKQRCTNQNMRIYGKSNNRILVCYTNLKVSK